MHVCARTQTRTCTHGHTCMHVHTSIDTCTPAHVYTHVHTHEHTYPAGYQQQDHREGKAASAEAETQGGKPCLLHRKASPSLQSAAPRDGSNPRPKHSPLPGQEE